MVSKQQSKYNTQWAAQFFAAAELTRRGYLVSFTFGNAPVSDLQVQSPQGVNFTIDVKGQVTKNFWQIQKRSKRPGHYFIMAYVPKDLSYPQFFILFSDELMKRRDEYEARMIQEGKKYQDSRGGINWKTAFDYEDKWCDLPQ